jgi:hypothetical protein
MVNAKIWSYVEAPWETSTKPTLEASFVQD